MVITECPGRLLLIESAQALLHGLGAGFDVQGVLGDFPRYAWHVRGTPCKHVGIRTEKVDEHSFLFGVEVGADRQHLAVGVVRVEWDLLGSLCWLKVARVAVGLRSFSGQGLELCDELG